MFSQQFWVVDAPFERSSPSRLQFSRVFTKYIPASYGAKRPCHYTRFTVFIHLPSFVEDSENTEDHWALPPLRSEKLLQYYFWRFVDTRPIVLPRFRKHFADILNSQLMYRVQLLMIKDGLTLILSFPKAGFLLRIRRSNFRCFLHRATHCIQCVQNDECSGETESFVSISRQKPCIFETSLRDDL